MLRRFTHNFLFFALLCCSYITNASDSLKVKKIEYFEDGKLVRAEYFDTIALKTKEVFINYREFFEGLEKNGITIIQSENGKPTIFITYHVNIIGDSVFFYDNDNYGSIQKVIYDDKNRYIESNYRQLYIKSDTIDRTMLYSNVDKNFIEKRFPLTIKYKYDQYGNKIEDIHINNNKIVYKIFHEYDSLNRVNSYKYIQKNENNNTIGYGDYIYQGTSYFINYKSFKNRKLNITGVNKCFFDDQNHLKKVEKYIYNIIKYQVIGEPKLTFTQENIYENNRIIKIIYTDHILNKSKIHELKYEFY